MGFYFRKSIGFGPFRLNFSKSGIGVSAGVRGARVSTGPRGTYINAGTHGFYYRQKINTGGSRPSQPPPISPQQQHYFNPVSHDAHQIHSADVSSFVNTSNAKLIEQINEASNQMRFAPFFGVVTGVVAIILFLAAAAVANGAVGSSALTNGIGIIVAMILVISGGSYLTWRVHNGDQLKRTTPLFYELEYEAVTNFEKTKRAIQVLSRSARIWRVQTQQSNWDWKRNAGASSLITRTPAIVRQEQPPYIATNVEVWSLKLSDQTLYFLPDYIFVRQGKRYGAISYDSFHAEFAPTRFIEDDGVPNDARVVSYTWQYVNKKGGPDRRFSNNRQIPIMEYGFVHLTTASGLNIHLHVSSLNVAKGFASSIDIRSQQTRPFSDGQRQMPPKVGRPHAPYIDPELKNSFTTLGIDIDSTSEQIVTAYRQMAKMYHPDRLNHLAPEFVEMAEERMKGINAAYDVMKRSGRV